MHMLTALRSRFPALQLIYHATSADLMHQHVPCVATSNCSCAPCDWLAIGCTRSGRARLCSPSSHACAPTCKTPRCGTLCRPTAALSFLNFAVQNEMFRCDLRSSFHASLCSMHHRPHTAVARTYMEVLSSGRHSRPCGTHGTDGLVWCVLNH